MPLYKPFILFYFLFAFAFNAFSQVPSATHTQIRDAVEKKDFNAAIKELTSLQKAGSKIFKANNYDYLLARLYEKKGDFGNAASNFQSVILRNSILKEYALWHLSQIMRSTGNLMMERLYLQELSLIYEKSLLKNAVNKRFAKSHFESGNYNEAIKLLKDEKTLPVLSKGSSENAVGKLKEAVSNLTTDISREDLVLLAESYLLINKNEEARSIYNGLVNNLPKANQPDDFALDGAKGLDKLEVGKDNFGKVAPKLSDEEHFKRAEIYQFNRNFPLARLHYEAIVSNYPQTSKAATSIYQIARGFGQERNFEKAIEWYEKLQSEYPNDELATSALYQAAGEYANLDKTQEAVSRYEKYINENTDAENLERAYLNIIDAYRDAGDTNNALKWTAKAQTDFKDEMGEAVALFSQIRIYISKADWQNALKDLTTLSAKKNLGGIKIAGGTNNIEVEFLRGFVLEKLGRFDEAIDVYLSVEDGLKNYYGWRSSERIENLSKNPQASKIIEQKFKKYLNTSTGTLTDSNASLVKDAAHKAFRLTQNKIEKEKLLARISRSYELLGKTENKQETLANYKDIPSGKIVDFGRKNVIQTAQTDSTKSHKTIAAELLFLGLFDEATPELETALREDISKTGSSLSDFPKDTAYTLAVFYKRGDMANRAVGYIEPLWRKVPDDFKIELIPRETLELLYPKPYQASLNKYGKEKNVDPRFLLSIMRQESRYIANIKSNAAARGLMQFISNTSNKMAEEMKIEDFKQDDLYDPPTAIRFGSHYISNIFKDFPNQPQAVAASYNGGEDRMMRWLKRANTDNPDQYVPEVIFTQTKDYVYKVMANYRVYKMLYDENLKDIIKSK